LARVKPAGKLTEIADAALAAFGRGGFRLTQMADVAKLCHMSPGALYGYVESKDALFYLAMLQGLRELDPAMPLPVRVGSDDEAMKLLERAAASRLHWPLLSAALKRPKAADFTDEAKGIAGELFDLVLRDRGLIWLLSACSKDLPELAKFHNRRIRGRYLEDFNAWTKKRAAAGQLRPEASTPAAARAVLEMITWMAIHRLHEPIPMNVGDAESRMTVADLAAAALALT
jgi:AcrR family transcriptional regulator